MKQYDDYYGEAMGIDHDPAHECMEQPLLSMCCDAQPVADDVYFCGRCKDHAGWRCSVCDTELEGVA